MSLDENDWGAYRKGPAIAEELVLISAPDNYDGAVASGFIFQVLHCPPLFTPVPFYGVKCGFESMVHEGGSQSIVLSIVQLDDPNGVLGYSTASGKSVIKANAAYGG
jgi:hypothetical protein